MTNPGEINNFAIDLKTRLRRFKQEWLVEFLERVRPRTPVKTGALQRGWGGTMKQTSIEVWNTQPYAAYIEYGTPTIAPRAMLRTTLLEAEQISEVAKQKAGIKT